MNDMTLSPWAREVLACVTEAAEAGRAAPTGDELQERCGCDSISTTVNLVQRLEQLLKALRPGLRHAGR